MDAPGRYPPIEDYGVIGNCRTAALVSREGSIDWLCLPHFSGASIFAALLDAGRGGRFVLRPLDVVGIERRYLDDTNVLETTFVCATGRMRLTDFMTITPEAVAKTSPGPQHELVRIAECVEGEVVLEALYEPRPDYARHVPRLARRGRLGWVCTCQGLAAYLVSDIELAPRDASALAGRCTLRAGDTRHAVVTACEKEAVVFHPLGDATRERLRQTVDWWKQWSAQCTYDGPYRAAVVRSLLALKLLTFCLSGAMMAAATTSLPEKASGTGNWDYRYCWLRDSSMVLMSFIELGFDREGTAFLEWLLHATKLTQPRLQVMYDGFGETALEERELAHLEGYGGIGPVRIGNAAHTQLQLDIYGEVVLAAYCYVTLGGALDRYERKLLAGFGEVVRTCWRLPDQGIWEVRTKPRHNTYSKLMCWVAIDRLVRLDEIVPLGIDKAGLRDECARIREDIETNGYNAELQSFVGYYGGAEPDATLLLLARHEFLAHDDRRMLSTYRYIERRLGVDGFLFRYPPASGYEGLADADNLFGVCAFWRAEYLAGLGRLDEATRAFERLLGAATDLGLYAEEFDVKTKRPLGNFPQAFTHVGLIRAAIAIDAGRKAAESRGARA